MSIHWLKRLKNSVALLSLGVFANCEAKSLESMANKYSYFEGVEVVKASELAKNQKIIFVDVRPIKEREISVIEGSISEDEFLKKMDTLVHKELKIVAYCTIGHRSGKFAQRMNKKGIPVANLYGGILGWIDSGKVVFNVQGDETLKVHVYGADWNILPDPYKGVW
jgi:rhodanese-related sulfurtransferase